MAWLAERFQVPFEENRKIGQRLSWIVDNVIVECDLDPSSFQLRTGLHHFIVRRNCAQDFEHNILWRKQRDELAQQYVAVAVDKGERVIAEHSQAEQARHIDHRAGGVGWVSTPEVVGGVRTKQELISKNALVGRQNRLPGNVTCKLQQFRRRKTRGRGVGRWHIHISAKTAKKISRESISPQVFVFTGLP